MAVHQCSRPKFGEIPDHASGWLILRGLFKSRAGIWLYVGCEQLLVKPERAELEQNH